MKALVAALAVLVVLAAPVAAQPSATSPSPEPEPATYTQAYGWKILLVDVASVAAAIGGAFVFLIEFDDTSDESPATFGTTGPKIWAVAGAAYLFGGPIIHSLHGNRSGAAKSFGLRAGLPLLGIMAGSALDGDGPPVGLAVAGIAVAILLDDAVVARREVRSTGRAAPYAAPIAGGGVTLGVAGAF